MIPSKQTIRQFLQEKTAAELQFLEESWTQQQAAVWNETKSTAGDKHETGRAMAQLEMEQLGKTLHEKRSLVQLIQRLPQETTNAEVSWGSLVHTSGGVFYLSVGLGAQKIENQTVFCVGTQAPIYKQFLGKKCGDLVSFQGKSFQILEIS